MEKPGITKHTTVEAFMKAVSELRVGADAVALFTTRINTLAESIAKAAEANARKESRTTIMATDAEAALASVTGSTSDLPYLFKQLEKLNAKDTADLASLIRNWVDSH